MTGAPLLSAASTGTVAEAILFYAFAGMTAGSALAVVVCRNVVRMAVALLFALSGVAALFFLLHAEFLAAVQLVVYVGGTLILIVFGIMLTSKSPHTRFEPKRGEVVIASVLAVLLLATLIVALPRATPTASAVPEADAGNGTSLQPMTSLGVALLGEYLLPFELASVLLLAVMIGAAYLARGRR